MNQRMVDEAFKLASSRQMCCQDDLKLLIELLQKHMGDPRVVQLGAGSGTMALAILGVRDDVDLWTVDNDQVNLDWEARALGNAGFKVMRGHADLWEEKSARPRYRTILSDSAKCGRTWKRDMDLDIDLVVIDADHSYRAVKRDLRAWGDKANLVFCHDYDGTSAPRRYLGVKRACDEYFSRRPVFKAGWSAVFQGAG